MNIKRMADQYRAQVMGTGLSFSTHMLLNLPGDSCKKIFIGEYRTDIKRWYNHLKRALGSEKDLKELRKVWQCLVKLSELCEENTESLNPKRQLILKKIQELMNKFLEKLPLLIEKSLTRAVRESGIRLR